MPPTDAELGKDVSCTTSRRTGRYATGARLVAEAFYRRLTTPRGMLRGGEEEAIYGLDITELIGSSKTKSDIAAIPGRILAELQKDERAERVGVEVLELPQTNGDLKLQITISAHCADGPFELVIKASAVTAELVGITAEAA